jgi:hypothetical protein
MARNTTTRFIKWERLERGGKEATLIVRLMMACNDLSVANEAMSVWQDDKSNRTERRRGALLYFHRMQVSHLCEGMKIIEEISKDSSMLNLISILDGRTQKSFYRLKDYIKGGSKSSLFVKNALKIRNSLGFHYHERGSLIKDYILDRASRSIPPSSITRGGTGYDWHFEISDDIIDSIVVREFWNIPKDADARAFSDSASMIIHDVMLSFIDFSGELIWKYLER